MIPLLILAVIVCAAAVLIITQWDNINAAIIGLKYSEEEIGQMEVDVKTDFADKTGIDLDVIESMAENMTPEGEPIAPTANSETPGTNVGTQLPTEKAPATQVPALPNNTGKDTAEVEAILARFYALRSSFLSRLEGIKSNAYAQYDSLPISERGTNAKIRIGRVALSQATALESECDAKIAALLKELRPALKRAGLDEDLANDVEYYYASEKSLMKAKYMSKYKKYLS